MCKFLIYLFILLITSFISISIFDEYNDEKRGYFHGYFLSFIVCVIVISIYSII